MLVVLIWPHNERAVLSDDLSCCEPLPLEYVAGALREHHEVVIHDLRLDGPIQDLAGRIGTPGLVGVAIPYTTSVRSSRRAAAEAKAVWPTVPLVVGGHHPTVSNRWMDGFSADFAVLGEGGQATRELADQLERGEDVTFTGGLLPFHALTAIGLRPTATSLDDVALPDRTLLTRHRDRYFHSIYRPVALVRFTAGCPYRCNFCSLWRLTDRRYLTKDLDRIEEELHAISVPNVYVVDDEAFIRPSRMLDLAAVIGRSGLRQRYHMYVRTDTALRHPEVIARWAEIGLDSVLVGAESLDDSELNGYRKGTKAEQTLAAVRLFHSLGVKVRANFIVSPEYVEADFDRLARSVAALEVDMPSFSVLTPLPGTDLYDQTRDRLIDDDPELFDCYHTLFPTRIGLDAFYAALAGLLEATARRPAPGLNAATDPSVFYFSDDAAFDRMLDAIRRGHATPQRTDVPLVLN